MVIMSLLISLVTSWSFLMSAERTEDLAFCEDGGGGGGPGSGMACAGFSAGTACGIIAGGGTGIMEGAGSSASGTDSVSPNGASSFAFLAMLGLAPTVCSCLRSLSNAGCDADLVGAPGLADVVVGIAVAVALAIWS